MNASPDSHPVLSSLNPVLHGIFKHVNLDSVQPRHVETLHRMCEDHGMLANFLLLDIDKRTAMTGHVSEWLTDQENMTSVDLLFLIIRVWTGLIFTKNPQWPADPNAPAIVGASGVISDAEKDRLRTTNGFFVRQFLDWEPELQESSYEEISAKIYERIVAMLENYEVLMGGLYPNNVWLQAGEDEYSSNVYLALQIMYGRNCDTLDRFDECYFCYDQVTYREMVMHNSNGNDEDCISPDDIYICIIRNGCLEPEAFLELFQEAVGDVTVNGQAPTFQPSDEDRDSDTESDSSWPVYPYAAQDTESDSSSDEDPPYAAPFALTDPGLNFLDDLAPDAPDQEEGVEAARVICAVCTQPIDFGRAVVACGNGHAFDAHCIRNWRNTNPRCPCPTCRRETGWMRLHFELQP